MNFEEAKTQIAQIENGWDKLPICMKHNIATPDNPNALGAPENFEITIRDGSSGSRLYCRIDWGCHDHAWFTRDSLNMDVAADGTAISLF